MARRFFLIAFCLFSALLVFFFLLPLKKEPKTNIALNELLHGNFYLAEKLLNSNDYFKLGLIYQKMGHFDEAAKYFEKAAGQKNKDDDIACAKMLNAYLQGRVEKNLIANSPHALFFQALCFYLEENYEKANLAFEAYCNPKITWLDHLMDSYFPSEWIDLHIAHGEIELGNQIKARKKLEALESPESNILLAISYLKDKGENSNKLAFFYLEQTHLKKCRFIDQKRIMKELENEIKKQDHLVLPFLSLLDKWNEKESFDELSSYAVKNMFTKGHFNTDNQHLREKIANHFISLLKSNNVKDLSKLFATLEKNNLLSAKAISEFTQGLEKELISSLAEDDESLKITKTYLELFKSFSALKKERPSLANLLLHQGKLCWLKEGSEKKGTHLLKLGLNLKEKKKETLKEIESFFEAQYQAAENSNFITRLSLIYAALNDLEIDPSGFLPKGALGNYLADASYQFSSRNYSSAKAHAELILRIDPNNEKARRLYGLSCYHTGLYKEAVAYLQTLDSPDEYATKALNFSIAQANQKGEKQLVSLDILDSLDENE